MRNFYKSRKFHGSGCQHIHRLASSPLTLRPSAAAVAIPHHVAEPRKISSISCTQSLIPWFEMNRPKSKYPRSLFFIASSSGRQTPVNVLAQRPQRLHLPCFHAPCFHGVEGHAGLKMHQKGGKSKPC